jgi:hypothetical protein
MDQFMRSALRDYYINGVDIIVDKGPGPDTARPLTRADEQQLGGRAFLSTASPLQRVDWSCDHAGRYQWVRYHLGALPRRDEADAVGPRRYLTLTPHQWRLYYVQDGAGGRQVTCRRGRMALGVVPVVPFYFRLGSDEEHGPIPTSLLTRIAPVARALLNLLSQGQLDIYMAIGILAATGIDPQQLPREVAPMCWLAFPEGASIQHIRPAVEHIQEKRAWAAMLMESILRMGKLTGVAGATNGSAQSGFQVEAQRTDLDAEMAATAGQAERVERQVVRLLISRKEGRMVSHEELGYGVEYNRKYVLSGVTDLVRQARQFAATGGARAVPEMWKLFLQRILDAVVRKSDPRYSRIKDQLERLDENTAPEPKESTTP